MKSNFIFFAINHTVLTCVKSATTFTTLQCRSANRVTKTDLDMDTIHIYMAAHLEPDQPPVAVFCLELRKQGKLAGLLGAHSPWWVTTYLSLP